MQFRLVASSERKPLHSFYGVAQGVGVGVGVGVADTQKKSDRTIFPGTSFVAPISEQLPLVVSSWYPDPGLRRYCLGVLYS